MHYHFTTRDAFEQGIKEGKFLEYAYVHNNIYGTSVGAVRDVSQRGKCCILDIDVQGARQVRKSDLSAIFVFIAPPSVEELEKRLRGRGTESEEQIQTRLTNAKKELATLEEEPSLYDFVLVNDSVESCFEQLKKVAEKALEGRVGPFDGDKSHAASPKLAMSSTMSLRGWIPDGASESPVGVQSWTKKTALVTGAGSLYGLEIIQSLLAHKMKVIAVGQSKSEIEKLQTIVKDGNSDSQLLPVVCDMAKEKEIIALPKIIKSKWPDCGMDVFIHAASARSLVSARAEDESILAGTTASWVSYASIDILGTAIATREAVKDMKQQSGGGYIVYVIPSGSHNGGIQHVAAATIKSMAQSARMEAQTQNIPISVTCIELDESLAKLEDRVCAKEVSQAVITCLSHDSHSASSVSCITLTQGKLASSCR